jgi:uncharacterized protein YggE
MKRLLIIASIWALVAVLTIQAAAKEITVRGHLEQTVEAGGWLIIADTDEKTDKYLLLNPQRFRSQAWFRTGAQVEATGETKPDAVTIYQEGVPFEARTMRSIGSKGTETVSDIRPTRVTVSGEAIVQAQPDTALLLISVVTQNKNALGAQTENADKSSAVIRAVKTAAGAGAEIKTSGYSLTPQRVYKQDEPPTIRGYEARNTVSVTMSDLARVGALIDAASQAGANNVDSVSFTLRKDRPARDQALSEAMREAISKARVLAQALGGRVSRIIEVQESGTIPRPVYQNYGLDQASRVAQSTPIEVGTLDVRAQVQLIAEIETGQ